MFECSLWPSLAGNCKVEIPPRRRTQWLVMRGDVLAADRNIVRRSRYTLDAALPRGSLNLRPDNFALHGETEARQLSPMDASFAEIKASLLLLPQVISTASSPIHALAPFSILTFSIIMKIHTFIRYVLFSVLSFFFRSMFVIFCHDENSWQGCLFVHEPHFRRGGIYVINSEGERT